MNERNTGLRSRLVDVGVELVTAEGVQALSLREIARRAGVSHGAPRRYFPTHLELLSAIARSVALPPDFFDDKVNLGNSVLRVIHYPPMPPEPTPSVRAGAHEDINVITLLLGAEEPGLEVLSKKGEWLPINPPPDSLVCNVGDMLQRLTNRKLRSTTHRVTNPPRERASKARYSLPFFLHFNPDFLIETLPQCIDAQHPNQFPQPISAHEFLQERLREIKLI